MNIQKHFIEPIKVETDTNEQQITDELLMRYFNMVYQDTCNFASTFNGRDFTWNYWITDIKKGQNEYTLSRNNQDLEGLDHKYDVRKILSVYKKTSEKDEYRKIMSYDYGSLPNGADINTTSLECYFRADTNSVFIAPIPSEDISKGLKVVGSYVPKDLLLTSERDDCIIPREYDKMLWDGLCYWIYRYKKQHDEKNISFQEYENEKQKFKLTSGEQQKILYSDDGDYSDFF